MEKNIIPEYLTPQDIADRLRVSASTVRRWIKKGVLPYIVLPNVDQASHTQYRVHRDAYLKLIEPVTANS